MAKAQPKNKLKLPIWIASGVGLAYLLLKGTKLVEFGNSLEVKIASFSTPRISNFNVVFPLKVEIVNPTDQSLSLDSLQVVIFSQKQQGNAIVFEEIAKSNAIPNTFINPEKSTFIDPVIKGNAFKVGTEVVNLIKNQGTGATYRIDTTAVIAGNTITVTEYKSF